MSNNELGPKLVILARGYSLDDAIDLAHEETNLLLYRMTRLEKYLRFKPGMQPSRFVVQQLKRRFVREVIDTIVNEKEKYAAAFRAACHLVDLSPKLAKSPTEKEMRADPSTFVEWKGGVKIASEEWVDEIDLIFGGEAVEEVGKIAWEMSKLRPGADGPFV